MAGIRIAITDFFSNSYFPVLAAQHFGLYAAEGVNAEVELVMPLKDAYEKLRGGDLAFVGDGIHDCLPDGPGFTDLCALLSIQQQTPWLLVMRPELGLEHGDLESLRGLRIAAARGPDFAFRGVLKDAGIKPDDEVEICALTGAEVAGVSYGVAAAHALDEGKVDGFWANAMGAAVAVHRRAGVVHLDVRREDAALSAKDFSFGALMTTTQRAANEPDLLTAVMKAVMAAQRLLRDAPHRAAEVGARYFPDEEAGLISGLVERDRGFYDPSISPESIGAMNRFSQDVGLLNSDVDYDALVPARYRKLWSTA